MDVCGRSAILARQREGDVGSYHYFDNFKAAIKRAGEVMLDLIPKIYDAPRVVRIIGKEEGSPDYKPINQPVLDPVEMVQTTLNDLSVGRFDVRVDAGPSFTTRREEARESMLQATQANPQLWMIAGDLIIKAMDNAIEAKMVTYDFARLMESATEVSTSRFGDALIARM